MFVGKRMTKNPVTITKDDGLRKAMDLMKTHNIRRLPVVEGKRVIGIVSNRDVQRASASEATTLSVYELNYLLDKVKIVEIMTRDVITIRPSNTIEEAARLLLKHKIGGLPVVESGELVGIITESDIFKIFIEVMGLEEESSRIELLVEDKPGKLFLITNVIKEHNVNIVSVVSVPSEEKGKVIVVMRLKTKVPGPIVESLENKGFKVLSTIT